jgi:PAS domain S-box-containing protein
MVQGRPEEEVHADLWEAVRAGLVFRLENAYTFLHDRVQEAAYALIPESERAAAHLRIGRVLASRTVANELEEKIFEIVNQLDRGAALITAPQERVRVAELNLIAGKRAKISTAYASALTYFVAGAALLAEDSWERRHDLTFALELHRAECEFLTGEFGTAEERLNVLSARTATTSERASAACLRADLYTTLDQSDRAIAVGLEYLQDLGIEWSPHPTEQEVRREYECIWRQLGSSTIEELIDLPLTSDPVSLGTLDVLTKIMPPAFFTDANLLSLAICRAVNLSLQYGNSDGSCFAYVMLGMIAGPHFGNYQAGFRFGRLGYELVQQPGLKRFQARTYVSFGNLVVPWTQHVLCGRDPLRRAFEIANQSGDLTFAAYSCGNLNSNLLAAGDPLVEVEREAESGLQFAQKARFGFVVDWITPQLGLIRTLRGLTPKFGSFDDAGFDEVRYERHLSSNPAFAMAECWYWIRKLQARFFAGEYASALEASLNAQQLLWSSPSCFETAEYHFYSALSRAASCDSVAASERQQHLETLAVHHRQLQVWAENCPENFENRAALVAAEIASLEGRELDAERLYEQAIRSARANGFVHNEALANELAARFYAARGLETIAHAYLRNARYCYLRWGADGKVRQLDALYPYLRGELSPPGQATRIAAPVEHLDLAAIIRVSQATSGEIVLEKLINTLMRTALEQAGAERSLLILGRGVEHRIEAEARSDRDKDIIHFRQSLITPSELPESLLRYVIRTQESVILSDASAENIFSEDEYIRRKCPRSVLCLPLIKQRQLIGILYFENNLAPGVFTPNRLAMLELIASQAAISLEQARLYGELADVNKELNGEIEERRRAEEALRRSEAYLSEAQRLSRTGSFGWDASSGKIYWSQETFRIFEYEPLTEPTLELVLRRTHPEDRALVRQVIDRVVLERKDFDFEHRLLMPNGSVKYLRVVGRPSTEDESGNFEFVGAVTDITEREQAEETVRKTHAQLAHVTRVTALGELTASIAHEVNQPLTAIINNASACLALLPSDTDELDEICKALSEIADDAERASAVLARIRGLIKKSPLEKARLHLHDVVSAVLVLVRPEAAARRVTVQAQIPEDLPLIFGDRVQLQQVLLNLVMNGMDAMNSVEEHKRLLLISGHHDEYDGWPAATISVKDFGIGLKAGEMERFFDAFYTTKPQGMGMGLAISRSIVEEHGGRLWAEPNKGPGATFLFSLPTADRPHHD